MSDENGGGRKPAFPFHWLPPISFIAGAIILTSYVGAPSPRGLYVPDIPALPLTTKDITECSLAIRRTGIVRQWPEPDRVNVDETRWGGLPSTEKVALMAMVVCHAHGRRMHEMRLEDSVTVYGYHTGRRLGALTMAGPLLD